LKEKNSYIHTGTIGRAGFRARQTKKNVVFLLENICFYLKYTWIIFEKF